MKVEIREFADGYELKIDDSSFQWKGKSIITAESIGIKVTEALLQNRENLIKNIDN